MTIKDLVSRAHQTAKDKGFWDEIQHPAVYHALIHSEVSEAMEEVRQGNDSYYIDGNGGKPCGELAELADVIIRVADVCGHKGWNLEKALEEKMAFNEQRSRKHGNKRF